MRGLQGAVIRIVRDAIRSETMTFGGRINLASCVICFAVMMAAGAMDVVQALVRIGRPEYTAGGAPLLPLMVVFAVMTVCCVVAVDLIDALKRRGAANRIDG